MEFIRWHALSSYVRWYEYIERKEIKCLEFINYLPEISLKLAEENRRTKKAHDARDRNDSAMIKIKIRE